MENSNKKSLNSLSANLSSELVNSLYKRFSEETVHCGVFADDVTLEIPAEYLLTVCRALRDEPTFGFGQLIDLCGVDYMQYGMAAWDTKVGSGSFSRGFVPNKSAKKTNRKIKERFAVIYHLLSHSNNQRLRLRTYAQGDPPSVDSVIGIWKSADWFEREAFDLFGILFQGHPDLRRILTDYGFSGYPMRKNFSLTGMTEMHYDPEKKRVVYKRGSTSQRTVIPRVIREKSA